MRATLFPLSLRCWLIAFALGVLLGPAHAQRVALLVGNANYSVGKLTNPPNDVAQMEKALAALGFRVQKVLNANQNQMKRAVRDFGTAAQGAEVAFLYYSGHGTQANGENYLLPVGASIEKESDYEVEAVSANAVLAQIRGAQPKAAILVLDACRDNPLAALTKSATKGLGRMSAPTGTMIAFATAPGDTASDNGHYARVLAKELQKPGQELIDVFRNTAAEVRKLSAAGKVQDPRISEMSINERLYLAGPGTQVASITPQPTGVPVQTQVQADPEQEAWELAKKRDTVMAYETYLKNFPQGRYAAAAKVAMDGQQAAANTAAVPQKPDYAGSWNLLITSCDFATNLAEKPIEGQFTVQRAGDSEYAIQGVMDTNAVLFKEPFTGFTADGKRLELQTEKTLLIGQLRKEGEISGRYLHSYEGKYCYWTAKRRPNR